MAETQNGDSGCFRGILRRLLCQGSLQTHPSDQIPEPKKPQAKTEATGAPGLVARLMGLDSLPDAKWVPKGKAPESVTRSRSVNFMEYLLEFNVAQGQTNHQHRRVRTSVSFREVPTLMLQQQNPDLFLMCLDEDDEKKKGLKGIKGKASLDLRDMKQKQKQKDKKSKNKKEEKVSKFIDEPRRVSAKRSSKTKNGKGAKDFGVVLPGKKCESKESEAALKKKKNPLKPMHQRQESATGEISKKRKNQLVIEELKPAECSSENSSPVSVLDANEFPIFDCTPSSDEKRYVDLNSKRKSSLMAANCGYSSSSSASTWSYDDFDQLGVIKNKDYESMDDQTIEYYSELAAKLHQFTEEAILQSNWGPEKLLNFEYLEEICMELGQHVLEILLQQLIDELVGFNMEICIL